MAGRSDEPILVNYFPTMSLEYDPPKNEWDKELRTAMLRYRDLMQRNPHPQYISVPNPKWHEWMELHRDDER